MDIAEAFEITIDLARQSMVDPGKVPEVYQRQKEAIDQIEDLAVNHFGDD